MLCIPQIDEKHKLFHKGDTVVDLVHYWIPVIDTHVERKLIDLAILQGYAPGSWSQVNLRLLGRPLLARNP